MPNESKCILPRGARRFLRSTAQRGLNGAGVDPLSVAPPLAHIAEKAARWIHTCPVEPPLRR
eukprot:3018445-Pyramimonas_sp.AAC.1